MQRSRKALRQKRASEKTEILGRKKKNYIKVSLSVAIFIWGLLFILNLSIGHGDGFRDGVEDLPKVPRTWNECPAMELNPKHLIQNEDNIISNDEYKVNAKSQNHVYIAPQEPKYIQDSKKTSRTEKTRSVPLGLDEFKDKAFNSKSRPSNGNLISTTHRLELSGAEYNYASASKGAKVLAYNKEAKGASNVLNRDEDKYLRNPCSSEEKFVILELSEETLVDTIEIANFEHHSSNLKDFELLGSLVYPTESWVKVGNFTAGNVRHTQRFVFSEPKWVRYIKFNLISHYVTGFYCTLSVVQVYGVDAVDMMLEDMVSLQENKFSAKELESDTKSEDLTAKNDAFDGDIAIDGSELGGSSDAFTAIDAKSQHQVGRLPGDTVLKILMQKVRIFDINLSLMEKYLDELNSKYGGIFEEIDAEIEERDVVMEKMRTVLRSFHEGQEIVNKHVDDLVSWKSLVSVHLDDIARDNAFLRSEVVKIRENQVHMENKGVVIFLVSLAFGSIAIARLFLDKILFFYYCNTYPDTSDSEEDICTSKFQETDHRSWVLLLLSCTTIIIITSL